jgi:hypothetical protein
MDQYSNAELTEFIFLAYSSADTQFQYWITITFAVVVAGFVAGKRLAVSLRILIAVLYLLASAILAVRFQNSMITANTIRAMLLEADAYIVTTTYLAPLRIGLFLLGSAAAVFFLIRPSQVKVPVPRKGGASLTSGTDEQQQ